MRFPIAHPMHQKFKNKNYPISGRARKECELIKPLEPTLVKGKFLEIKRGEKTPRRILEND